MGRFYFAPDRESGTISSVTLFVAVLLLSLQAEARVAAPKLVPLRRIVVVDAEGFLPVRDAQDRLVFCVAQRKIIGDANHQKLSSYDAEGKELETTTVDRAHGPVWHAERNSLGETIALTSSRENSRERMFAVNLKTGKRAELSRENKSLLSFAFLDQIRFQGRNSAAVIETTDYTDPKTFKKGITTTLRVLDEDTGQTVRELELEVSSFFKGTFGVDQKGKLKLLLFGQHPSGIFDVDSGRFDELYSVAQPSNYPREENLAIGSFWNFLSDQGKPELLAKSDLLNSKLRPVRDLPANTVFVGSPPQHVAVTISKQSLHLIDLSSLQALGPEIPTPAGFQFDSGLSIEESGRKTLAVVTYRESGNDFVYKTMTHYVDVGTGTLLRSKTSAEQVWLESFPFVDSSGRFLALEASGHGEDEEELVDISQNRVLARGRPPGLVDTPFLSRSGEVVGVRYSKNHQLCVFNWLDFHKETCLHDAGMNPATLELARSYAETRPGSLRIRRDNGLAEYEVR